MGFGCVVVVSVVVMEMVVGAGGGEMVEIGKGSLFSFVARGACGGNRLRGGVRSAFVW